MSDSDSDNSDESSDTVTALIPVVVLGPHGLADTQYWSCPSCYNDLGFDVASYCTYCLINVYPIPRWWYSYNPVVVNRRAGYDGDGADPDTEWCCADCYRQKLFLGGETVNEPLMEGYCPQCQDETLTLYKDDRESYCCRICRYLMDPLTENDDDGNERRVFEAQCPHCDRFEAIGKVNAGSGRHTVLCCSECRAETMTNHGEALECDFCGDDTHVVEIDDDD